MWQPLKSTLCFIRYYLDLMIDFIFSLHFERQKKQIPDLKKEHSFLAESANSLAKKIRKKELKSEDLVRAVIERIKEVNPIINAIAEDRYEAALAEAREVDKLIDVGLSDEIIAKKPYLGVPFTTKESQAVKGMKYTMGLWERREERALEDSAAIIALKDAGAIPVATTNLPELLVWQETRNPVYGMTLNPHHTGRSPGGSSGAEAALTATFSSTISLCSDLGGSTRMPAFYCGMFGHHPTPGTNNTKGVFFRNGDEESMVSLGFIAKHVEDLAPLTKVLAADKAPQLKLDREVNIKDLKFYYLESGDDCHVSSIRPELKEVMQRVISKISKEVKSPADGPQPYTHEGFSHMYQLWNYWMTKEPDNYANLLNNRKGEAKWCTELTKKLFCMSKHCFFTIMQLIEKQVLPKPSAQWGETLTKQFKEDLFEKLGDNGVLLMPSAPHPTPYHYSCILRPYNFAYWAVVNALKCPATQVPIGVNAQGLPLGIQVVAAPYNDKLCLEVAAYLEKEFGGSIPACKVH